MIIDFLSFQKQAYNFVQFWMHGTLIENNPVVVLRIYNFLWQLVTMEIIDQLLSIENSVLFFQNFAQNHIQDHRQ